MAKPLAIQGGRLLTRGGSVVLIGSPTDPCCCGQVRTGCECDPSKPIFEVAWNECVNGRARLRVGTRRYHVVKELWIVQGGGSTTVRDADPLSPFTSLTVAQYTAAIQVCWYIDVGAGLVVPHITDGYCSWAYRVDATARPNQPPVNIDASGTNTGADSYLFGGDAGAGVPGVAIVDVTTAGGWTYIPATILTESLGNRHCSGVESGGVEGVATFRNERNSAESEEAYTYTYRRSEKTWGPQTYLTTATDAFAAIQVRRDLSCVQGPIGRPFDPRVDAEVQRAIQQATGQRPDCPTCGQG